MLPWAIAARESIAKRTQEFTKAEETALQTEHDMALRDLDQYADEVRRFTFDDDDKKWCAALASDCAWPEVVALADRQGIEAKRHACQEKLTELRALTTRWTTALADMGAIVAWETTEKYDKLALWTKTLSVEASLINMYEHGDATKQQKSTLKGLIGELRSMKGPAPNEKVQEKTVLHAAIYKIALEMLKRPVVDS